MLPVEQLRRYAAISWRHRWKALALAWVVCLAGWFGVSMIPNQYQASARIYADADAILGQTLRGIAVDGATAAQVDTLQRTLLSRPNLERVVARSELDQRVTSVAGREGLLTRLARDIRIMPQARNLFRIEYSDVDPRTAQSVVQATLNLFIERAASNDRQQMENARGFIDQQIASYETQLREAERRRADFRSRYLDLLPNDALGGVTRLETSRSRLAQLRGEVEDARSRRDLTRQQLQALPATLPAEAVGGGGGPSRAAEAERQLRELRLRYTDQHPDVIAARAALAQIRAGGDGDTVRGDGAPRGGRSLPNPAREAIQLRMVDADAQLVSLERQVRDETAEVERLEALARGAPQLQAQFQNLDRDYNVIRRNYEELLGRRESLQIAGAARVGADQVRLEIIEPPTVPTLPIGPKRMLLSVGVLLAGLGAGAALAVLLATMDRSFHSLQDLRRLNLPILGAISSLQPPRRAGAVYVFAGALSLLFLAFGAVTVGGPSLLARVPSLVSRVLA
ncbi:XrtA system polysaccharide chain length determinant [Roseomonas sp. BN140053]|uniref:XrtA system polysaccharide chain length determinant n=1 Tax=Roseomonas sp. BN140053 TaxID=3391898 RepID=UPI0039EB5B26